jgi:hypothetical protein
MRGRAASGTTIDHAVHKAAEIVHQLVGALHRLLGRSTLGAACQRQVAAGSFDDVAFVPDFYFEDQTAHIESGAAHVPAGHVATGVRNDG